MRVVNGRQPTLNIFLKAVCQVQGSAGSIPDSYDIYRYLNLVRYSIFDTFVVNLPKTYKPIVQPSR